MQPKLSHRAVRIGGLSSAVGTGWIPPIFDPEDYSAEHARLEPEVERLNSGRRGRGLKSLAAPPPVAVDLRAWCSPIENQGTLGACTAHAAVGIVEYFERRSFAKYLQGSRLFVYKATRNLLGVTGDTGAWLKTAMAALVLCGVPSERYWEYTDRSPDFDREPDPFVYAVACDFEALKYFAHDALAARVPRAEVLTSVKGFLAAGIPAMFGFSGYSSFAQGGQPGLIPFPTAEELAGPAAWGHAVCAVGYDDSIRITNLANATTTTGALLIRNSWGVQWGLAGYGWMPYEYVLSGVALDFWSLLSMKWIDTDQFFSPASS